jgi:iron complex outermembrane receptor protein
VLYTPSDSLSLLVSGNYSSEKGNGTADVFYPYVNSSNPWQNSFYPSDAGGIDRQNAGVNARLQWDFGPATLIYIPAYTKLDDNSQALQSGGIATYRLDSVANSQELRLVSNNGIPKAGQVQWLAGIFWYKEEQSYYLNIQAPFIPFTRAPLALVDNQDYPSISTESRAVYGQATYGILDWLRAVGGIRYTHDEKHQSGSETTIAAFPPFYGVPLNVEATGGPTNSNVSYKAMLEADVAPKAMVYGGVTTGYHAGGEFVGTSNNTYGPEKISSFETGIKSRWLDDRIQVNLDGYYYDYSDVQTTVIVPPLAVGVFNAKSAKVFGSELDVELLVTHEDKVELTADYEDSRYTDFFIPASFLPSGGTPVPGGTSFAGEPFPLVSKWSGALGYQHTFALPRGASLVAGASSYLRTMYWTTIDQTTPLHRQPGYTNSGLYLTYASVGDKWNISAYVKNLEDHPDATSVITNAVGTFANLSAPRTAGVRFSVSF